MSTAVIPELSTTKSAFPSGPNSIVYVIVTYWKASQRLFSFILIFD